MTVGSLFAGIGGFDLAARWMGWRTAWFSEIEPYASAVLKKHWPDVPNHGDITQIKGADVEPVDILCGGFPCQDISLAGKGAGIEGTRSGLWSEYARLIEEIKPRYVVAENVSALRGRGLDKVLREIATLGYDAEWHCIPASYVGAPHRRDRIWIVAYANCGGLHAGCVHGRHEAEQWEARETVGGSGETLADSNSDSRNERRTGHAGQGERGRDADRSVVGTSSVDDAVCGRHRASQEEVRTGRDTIVDASWWSVEPNVGRVANGVPSRVDRLRCCGNAIVPQVAHLLFQAIANREAALA